MTVYRPQERRPARDPVLLKAREALAAGLVDFVTTEATLMREAEAMAVRLAAGATNAYGGIKQTMLRARTQGLESQLEDEAQTASRPRISA